MNNKKVNESSNDQQQSLHGNGQIQNNLSKKIQTNSTLPQQIKFYIQFLGNPQKLKNIQIFNRQSFDNKICYSDTFFHNIEITTLQTDFQSTRILIQYGNYKMEIQTIFTNLNESFFSHQPFAKGTFGDIYILQLEGKTMAIKKIAINQKSFKLQLKQIYRQYFMSMLASFIEVGPQMIQIFGYDIIKTKSAVFFVMEMCDIIIKHNNLGLEQNLKNNLLKMHSINFIHLDIKPSNVAFSRRLNKYVFLDFGFSRLVQQKFGEKTLTNFAGTISYCSQQMKKSYILQKKLKIDLYYNDLIGLKKSMKKINQNINININQFDSLNRNSDLQNKSLSNSTKSEQSFVKYGLHTIIKSIYIFQFKHYLFDQKFQQSFSILKKNYRIMPKCTYTLLKKLITQKNSKIQKQIQQIFLQTKQLLLSQKFQSHNSDEYLNTYLCENINLQTFSQVLPIYEILSMQRQNNKKHFENIDEIYKLFLFINPFSYENINNFDIDDLRKKLIKKIYEAFNDNYLQQDCLQCRYVSFVLSFFYEKLKPLNNVKVFLSLRLLFICIEQYDFIEEIQIRVIKLISDVNIKLLKLIQFDLFSNISLRDYNCSSKKEKIKLLDEIIIDQNMSSFTKKLKQFSNIMYHRQIYMIVEWKNRKFILQKISQIQYINTEICYQQIITTIKCLYYQKSGLKLPDSFQFPNFLALKIYSFYFKYFNAFQNQKQKNFHLVLSVFPSMATQIKLIRKNKRQQRFLKQMLSYSLQGNLHRLEVIGGIIIDIKKQYYSSLTKQLIINYCQKVAKLILNDNAKCQSQIYQYICFIKKIFFFVNMNKEYMSSQQKLSSLQYENMHNLIKNIHNFIKRQQIYYDQKEPHFKIYSKIIQLSFINQLRNVNQNQIQNILVQIIENLSPYPYKQIKLATNFFNILVEFKKLLYKPQNFRLQQSFLKICNAYISCQHFYVFEVNIKILCDYIQLSNMRYQYQCGLNSILKYVDYLKNNYSIFINLNYCNSFSKIVTKFCQTVPISFLSEQYKKLKQNKLFSLTNGQYSYIIFCIFLKIENTLQQTTKITQLIHTCLSFSSMSYYNYTSLSSCIYKVARNASIYKSKRKMFICRRRESHAINNKKYQGFVTFILGQAKLKIKLKEVLKLFTNKIQILLGE